jgi:DNA repair protein RecO (recombination protein O)
MHDITATDGLVLAKRSAGEANTRIILLTRDLGVVRASARSARLERSKLRYGLEALTYGRFALVQGKYDWKLTGAEGLSRSLLSGHLAGRRASGRVVRLLLRLLQGEGDVRTLYGTVVNGLHYVAHAREEEIDQVECVLVLRILSELGYVEHRARVQPFIESSSFSPELLAEARALRPILVRTINESLSATGL